MQIKISHFLLFMAKSFAFDVDTNYFVFLLQIQDNGPAVVDVFYSDCANTVCISCLQTPPWWSEVLLRRKGLVKKNYCQCNLIQPPFLYKMFLIFSCLMLVTCFARNFLPQKVKKVMLNKAENRFRQIKRVKFTTMNITFIINLMLPVKCER